MTWRIVTDARGTIWRERTRPGTNIIDREAIGEGMSLVRPGGDVRVVERGVDKPQSTSTVTASRSRRPPGPDKPASRFVVRLGMSVRRELDTEVSAINRAGYERFGSAAESGGWLFGHRHADINGVKILYASADALEHSPTSVMLADPVDVKLALSRGEHGYFLARSGLKLIGSWHSHPTTDATPSAADKTNWAHRLKKSYADFFTTIIVAASPDSGWNFPYLHAYRTSWDPAEPWGTKAITEAVRVDE